MKKIVTLFTTAVFTVAFCLCANGQTILAGGFGTAGLGVADGNTYTKTGTLGSGGFPFVSASKDGGAFYATGSGKLFFINAAASSFTDSMSISLSRISSSNESNILFANTARSLVRINTTTKSVVDSIVLGALWEITERPNAKEVWVTDSGKVHVVDYSSALTATTMQVAASPYDDSRVAFTPGGSMAYKGASSSKMLYKINPASKTVIDSTSTAPYGFSNMVVSDDSSKLFVCNLSNNTIRIYNAATLAVMDSIACTMVPFNIYRHPTRAEIWVVHHFSDSVSVYNENTKALIAAFNISGSPWYMAFGVNGAAGIHNVSMLQPVNLFPNPAKNSINVGGCNADDKISVLNMAGRCVLSRKAAGRIQSLDVSDLTPGTYIVDIMNSGGTIVAQAEFVKQ